MGRGEAINRTSLHFAVVGNNTNAAGQKQQMIRRYEAINRTSLHFTVGEIASCSRAKNSGLIKKI